MIIYDGNYDTAGTKTLAYDASTMLPEYNEVFDYGQGGMEFAGWSTKQQAASEAEVYQPGTLVTDVNWETTDTPDPLPDELDDAFSVDPGGDADILLTR